MKSKKHKSVQQQLREQERFRNRPRSERNRVLENLNNRADDIIGLESSVNRNIPEFVPSNYKSEIDLIVRVGVVAAEVILAKQFGPAVGNFILKNLLPLANIAIAEYNKLQADEDELRAECRKVLTDPFFKGII